MNGEELVPESAGESQPARRGRSRLGLIGFLLLLAFVIGVAITLWAFPRLEHLWSPRPVLSVADQARLPPVVTGTRQPAALRPADAAAQELLDLRVAQLEERLTRINIEAQAASGNAARAEGLLVAFAARRALDSGAPLGYIEGQLRLRFGMAQPRAVATIINASREPVTLVDLEAGLADLAPRLSIDPPGTSWWTTFKRETSNLVTIRKSTTPSPQPERALQRARRLLESGRVEAAMAEVERLPGRALADRWLQMARRYREARRALDLIETAAILEPRHVRSSAGTPITQPSPFAP